MNQSNRKPVLSERLKERLYPAVLELFSHNDFHQVTMREISRITGISTGTIYKYFSSKEELIFTILDEKINTIGGLVSRQIRGMKDIKEIFRRVFWVTMDFYDRNPGVAVTAFITVPMRTWMRESTFRRRYDLTVLMDHVNRARENGIIDTGISDRQLMDSYYMICYRHIYNWYFHGMKSRLADTFDDFFHLFWKIVKPS